MAFAFLSERFSGARESLRSVFGRGQTSVPVTFDAEDNPHGVQVTVTNLSGETFMLSVGPSVTIAQLKSALAAHLETDDYLSLADVESHTTADDNSFVSSCVKGNEQDAVAFLMTRYTTLSRYEADAGRAWQEMAAMLQDQNVDDATALGRLQEFLTSYPTLVNFQSRIDGSRAFKPLLSFAVEGVSDVTLREKCVDELINRGARVRIRHAHGFLVEAAESSGSAFAAYLKEKQFELRNYEAEAVSAWRDVSSKLCGETPYPAKDEDEMTTLVSQFCAAFPNMVNFQSNHALRENEMPFGYFGYAPLLAFAGAHACRKRRNVDANATRLGSMQELLRHGARLDVQHGGKTVLQWMRSERSEVVNWLESQLHLPVPEHVLVDFNLEVAVKEVDVAVRDSDEQFLPEDLLY
eukprot:TRINITY_DN28644_c0_g1_i2.p1 TRINITY_DN28644_c0_g1~~TRINITY_DN28644_c0_g1_i2.p1  ORF type:complete len:409 (-),score=62.40 TRINITY_DN28644_c0_g1_i2:2-1228(-)